MRDNKFKSNNKNKSIFRDIIIGKQSDMHVFAIVLLKVVR